LVCGFAAADWLKYFDFGDFFRLTVSVCGDIREQPNDTVWWHNGWLVGMHQAAVSSGVQSVLRLDAWGDEK